MKKKIKYLAVILAFAIMIVNTLPGTAVRVNASDLESVSENSIAALLSETATTPTESSDGTGGTEENPSGGTVTPPTEGEDGTVPLSTESGNETGKWSVKISYDFGGGEVKEDEKATFDAVEEEAPLNSGEYAGSFEYQLPEILPTRDNHAFEGWKYGDTIYSAGTGITFKRESHANAEVKFVAQWKETGPWTAVISFNLDGGMDANGTLKKGVTIEVQENGTAGCPDNVTYYLTQISEIPTKECFVFDHWSCGSEIITSDEAEQYVVINREDPEIIFTANWKSLPSVNVVYDRYDDTKDTKDTIRQSAVNVKSFEIQNLPTDDSIREGYKFVGWECLVNGEAYTDMPLNAGDTATFAWDGFADGETITFTAVWKELPKVNVIFVSDGETVSEKPIYWEDCWDEEPSTTFEVTVAPEKLPQKEDYALAGWERTNGEVIEQYQNGDEIKELSWKTYANGEISFEAVWEKLPEMSVVYLSDGKEISRIPVYAENLTDTVFKVKVSEEAPAKDYNKFAGWKCTIDGEETTYQNADVIESLSLETYEDKELHLEAVWKALPSIAIEYVKYDESKVEGEPIKQQTEAEDTFTIELLTDDSGETGYIFTGWEYEINGETQAVSANPEISWSDFPDGGTITFTAVWEKLPEMSVVYLSDGKEISRIPVYAENLTDTVFKVKVSEEAPAKDYNKFAGWKCTIDGEETTYQNTDVIESLPLETYEDKELHLEAVWKALPSVTIEYVRHDGEKITKTIRQETMDAESFNVELPLDDSKDAGYKFVGWKFREETYLLDGDMPTFTWADYTEGGNLTFTAVWLASAEINFVGGMEDISETIEQSEENEFYIPIMVPETIPFRDYHSFMGWLHKETGSVYEPGSWIEEFTWEKYGDKSITFTAQWKWDDYSIFGTEKFSLVAGNRYYLTDGTWTVNDDGYSYTGDITFSVREDGDYTFKKN